MIGRYFLPTGRLLPDQGKLAPASMLPPAESAPSWTWLALLAAIAGHAVFLMLLAESFIAPRPIMQTLPQPVTVSLLSQPAPSPQPRARPEPQPSPAPVKPADKPAPVKRKPPPKPQAKPAPIPKKTMAAPLPEPAAAVSPPPAAAAPIAAAPPKTAGKPAESAKPASLEAPNFNAAYLHNPAPRYPAVSRRLGEEGRVLLRVEVTEQGSPASVSLHASCGSSRLDQAALEAVRQWRFVPAKRDGRNVNAVVIVPVKFSIEG